MGMFPTSHKNYEGLSAVAEMYGMLDLVKDIKGSSMVELNVGGVKRVYTSMATIDKMRYSPNFKETLKKAEPDGSFFIDADPETFQIILHLYTDIVPGEILGGKLSGRR